MPVLSLSVLGSLIVAVDGQTLAIRSRQAQALLVYLAVEGRRQQREVLAELLWPGMPPGSGRQNLRQALYVLRQALPETLQPYLESDRETVGLAEEMPLELDATGFLNLVCTFDQRMAALTEAVKLYRGEFLTDFSVPDAAPFEAWQRQQAAYFQREFADSLEKLSAAHEKAGSFDRALPFARQWLAVDPLNEAGHRAVIRLLAHLGDRNRAIQQYEMCVQALQMELGIQPQAETTALYEAILRGELVVTPAEAITPAPAPDEAVASGPAIRLPHQATPFIGRQSEVEAISALLHAPEQRLVTLIGPGGTGKTRLSLQVAEKAAEGFRDGVTFVSLAHLSGAEELVPAVAKGLELVSSGSLERPRQQLLDYLRERQLLLVLDNFEHLILEGAGLVSEILSTAGDVKLLVTSRVRLNTRGEQLFPVAGMGAPDEATAETWQEPEEDAKSFSAVGLFLERARRVQPSFRLTRENAKAVAEICRLVAGMPLGIELAAAWLELLPPEEIAVEIRHSLDFLESDQPGVPDRQRSLRAAFESSWTLLKRDEQEAFQRLTVFSGSFSRMAAQAVSEASLRTLLGLTHKSWLQQTETGRFQLHELMRQYGYERLQANLAAWRAARERHAAYYAPFVAAQGRALRGTEQVAALDALDDEWGSNIRTAWGWLVEQGRIETVISQMLLGLFHQATIRGHVEELIPWLRQARGSLPPEESRARTVQEAILLTAEQYFMVQYLVLDESPNQELISKTWNTSQEAELCAEMGFWYVLLGGIWASVGSFSEGRQAYQAGLRALREKDEQWIMAYGLLTLSSLLVLVARDEEAQPYLIEAIGVFRKAGSLHEQAAALEQLGSISWRKQLAAEAIEYKRAALALFAEVGDLPGVAYVWHELSELYLTFGEFDKAFQAFKEWRRFARSQGFRREIGSSYQWESLAATRYSTLDHALEARKKSLAIARETGHEVDQAWNLWEMGELKRLRGDIEEARQWFRQALSIFEALHDHTGIGSFHRGLADIALGAGQWADAQRQFENALAHFEQDSRYNLPWHKVYAWSGLGRALLSQGETELARRQFLRALKMVKEQRWLGWDMAFLPLAGLAGLLASEEQLESAVELAAFVDQHKLTWNETRTQAQAVLIEARKRLTEEAAEAAVSRGQGFVLEEVIERFLANAGS